MALPSDCGIPLGAYGRSALLLVRIGKVIAEMGDECLAPVGITGDEYGVLAAIGTDGPESQFELARLLSKTPASIVAILDALESRDLVRRTRDTVDRRRTRVTLTTAGRAALKRADKLAEGVVADLLEGLDGDELRRVHDLLVRGLGIPAPVPA